MARAVCEAPLSISVDFDGQQPSLTLRGKANYSNIADVVAVLDRLADEHERCVSLDLAAVESLDTAAIEGLVGSANLFRERQKRLCLHSASDAVWTLLDRLLLSPVFCVRHDCDCKCMPRDCGIAAESWEMDVFTLPCAMSHCHEARARVAQAAEAVGFDRRCLQDVMLAVGEAVANAIEHGHAPGGGGSFTVSCLATREKLCVSVSDCGSGFDPEALPSLEESILMERGRGVHCMNAVMDEVTFSFDAGTTVRMVKLGV